MGAKVRVGFVGLMVACGWCWPSSAQTLNAQLAANSTEGSGNYFRVEYAAGTTTEELEYGVTYTVWIPPNTERLRGIIVHQHGCGTGACKGGETAAYDLHWQALARKWDCALLGPSYHQPEGADCREWCDPRNGSAQAFLAGLADLAYQSGHDELKDIPWCLWGHSGGGFWASLMQTMYPERIIAIWFRSGTAFDRWTSGEITPPNLPETMYKIPMVANPGAGEKEHDRFSVAWKGAWAMFQDYRGRGAPIAFAPDPKTDHQCGDSRYLAIPFFDACLAMRLPDDPGDPLRRASQEQAWLSDPLGNRAFTAAEYPGEKLAANWLPNAHVARAWEEYVTTGATSDDSQPESPTDLRLDVRDDQITLNWKCLADFESGIRQFVIYQDDHEIARIPDEPKGRFGRALFQSMSYHDTPEAPLPEMQWTGKRIGGSTRYGVQTINGVGLASEIAYPRPE